MAARFFTHYHLSKSLSRADDAKRDTSLPSFLLNLSDLTQQEFHAYLHDTLLFNIPYYKALARYQNRKQELIIYADSRRYKNEKAFDRLTATGLRLLKTGYSKKPKNPV